MAPPARYLFVRPLGILFGMTQPPATQPDVRLLRYLSRQPANTVPVDVERLSRSTGLARNHVAQALFALHRRRGIGVCTAAVLAPARPASHPAAELQHALQQLCEPHGGAGVLVDPDGLCMAQHGMAPHDAEEMAACMNASPECKAGQVLRVLPLYVGRHRPCRLHYPSATALEQDALVALVRHLHDLLETPV